MRIIAALLLVTSAAAAEETATVTITDADCANLVAHHAEPGVAYEPGVDVHGDPVAPADLPGHEPLSLDADDVAVDPRIPLTQYVKLPPKLLPILGSAEIDVGMVTVRRGVAYLGEKRLSDPAQHALAEACAELQQILP
ncbi:MAG: hypothetical protein QGF53_12970 [Alphaproteobacteria bacterium]|jgi:hypothetical protein|nr:hypothetical protein [Alphaproteobacteria bacterium]